MAFIQINKRFWGMSETDTLLSPWQCVFSDGLDGYSNPEYIKLAREIKNVISTWSDLPTTWIEDTQSNVWIFWANGNIYSTATGNIVYTMSGNEDIVNAIKIGTKYIRAYKGSANTLKLASIEIANTGVGVWAWNTFVTENYGSFTPALPTFQIGDWFAPLINDWEDFLYFGCWNRVYLAQYPTLPFFESMLTFEDQIVWLTKNGSVINIYLRNGRKYFWDWFSETTLWSVDLGVNIRFVYNTKNYDYVVAWAFSPIYASLYISQWQDFQLLRSWKFFNVWVFPNHKFAYSSDSPYGNNVMAIDKSHVFLFDEDYWAIQSYGNIVQWLPKAFVNEFARASSGKAINQCWLLACPQKQPNILYVGVEDEDWNCFVDSYFTDVSYNNTYQLSWYQITQKYDFWVAIQNKTVKFAVRCDTPEWTSISLEYRVDGDGDFFPLHVFSGSEKWHLLSQWIMNTARMTSFYEIQFRITLTTEDKNITPKLYNILMEYDQIWAR